MESMDEPLYQSTFLLRCIRQESMSCIGSNIWPVVNVGSHDYNSHITVAFRKVLIGITPISMEFDLPFVTEVSSIPTISRASISAVEIPNKPSAASCKIGAGRGVSRQRVGYLNHHQKAQKRKKLDA
ncbi:hypothetical protein EDD11_009035 [Mortierella claussenii]|nr:hypothetical protein EDD11_009035 [Mortierella claussenii]